MNPAGFIHSGYALRDCLRSMRFPYVEVHMSNIDKRGLKSVTAEAALGTIAGFGVRSYFMGLDALIELVADQRGQEKAQVNSRNNRPGDPGHLERSRRLDRGCV